MFFETYTPKNFCREYAEIKGFSVQLGMFMATALGIKPLMDDWIPTTKLKEFKKVCKKYGLQIKEDIIFVNVNKKNIPSNVLGREFLTTTSAYGYPLDSGRNGEVHLFISRDRNLLKEAMWYPVIIKDRVIFQPRIDSLKYGYILGYPDCCIKFFRKFNDWQKYSYLYEAYRNTKTKPSFLCNPFLKDTSFSYIYHMPCSYDCRRTMNLVKKLRSKIQKREPEFVKLTDRYLKMPFLVFYERKFYCFNGILKDNVIKYVKFYFSSPEKSKDIYGEYLRLANTIKLEGRRIVLSKNKNILKNIDVPLTNFAPEYPFLAQFS